jgi:MFS family permease
MTNQQAPQEGLSTVAPESGSDKRHSMRRVAWASGIGSVVEFYDFVIFGFAAALVFPAVFFPALGSAAGTVASFATLGVAFVARPVGGVIFGHFGDRLGRKKTLITTMMLMGVATLLVGLMPTAAQIGVVAPVLIVVCRILQGVAAGGEWAGAVLFTSEHAPQAKRGFWAVIPAAAGASTLAIAPLSFMMTSWSMSDEAFMSYGWRIPFLASILLLAVGMYIRMSIDETPVFKSEVAKASPVKLPLAEAFKFQRRQLLLGGVSMMMVPSYAYLGASYLTSYGTTELELSRNFVLAMQTIGGAVLTAAMIVGAVWSDRIGRRAVIARAQLTGLIWAPVLFFVLDFGSTFTFALGVCVTMAIAGLALGPAAAFLSELFRTRYRFTGIGFSYNVGQIFGGALTPFLAAAIVSRFGGTVFSIYLAALCAASLVSTLSLTETRYADLEDVT